MNKGIVKGKLLFFYFANSLRTDLAIRKGTSRDQKNKEIDRRMLNVAMPGNLQDNLPKPVDS